MHLVIFLAILSLQYLGINIYIEQLEIKNFIKQIRNDIQNTRSNITNEIMGNRIIMC
jgi:hypothetical protein